MMKIGLRVIIAVAAALLSQSAALARDYEGQITACGPEWVCVVDGEFEGVFAPGAPVSVSRFRKPFAGGFVIDVTDTYMVVKIEHKTPEYFVRPGDLVSEPKKPGKEKLKTLAAKITAEDVDAVNAAIAAEAAARTRAAAATEESAVERKTPLVEFSGDYGNTGDVNKKLYERYRSSIGAGGAPGGGKTEKSETSGAEPAAPKGSQPAADDREPSKRESKRRRKASEKE